MADHPMPRCACQTGCPAARHRAMPPRRTTTSAKPAAQDLGSLHGALVGVADERDPSSARAAQHGDAHRQVFDRQVERRTDVAKFPFEFRATTDIDDERRLVGVERRLQFLDLDPRHGLGAQASQEPRDESHDREQAERKQGIADSGCLAGERLSAGED